MTERTPGPWSATRAMLSTEWLVLDPQSRGGTGRHEAKCIASIASPCGRSRRADTPRIAPRLGARLGARGEQRG